MSRAPEVLTVVLEDRWGTYISIVHENEHRPYVRRTVQIRLTDEQRAQLEPQKVGSDRGTTKYEAVRECWLEPVPEHGEPSDG